MRQHVRICPGLLAGRVRLCQILPMHRILIALVLALVLIHGPDARASGDGKAKFEVWLEGVRAEAASRGLKASTISGALSEIEPIARVIELDRRQPEFTLTFDEYVARVVPDRRVRKGRTLLTENARLLAEVSARYRVQPRFIVALWGIETDFGRITGGFPVIAALATLAHDGRRSAYFRRELLDALRILDEGHITPQKMRGSWAGAMGQSQFMPSSFRRFAVDHDGDGRRDIWTTRADVFASAANYLLRVGWKSDRTWGRRIRLPKGFDEKLVNGKIRKRLSAWQALGVRKADGGDLPKRDLPAALVRPTAGMGPVFAVYSNYEALLRWNRSSYFALSVGMLSDRIAGR